jgi:lipid-A-disaccharide synthase
MAGSREGEIKRLLPILQCVAEKVQKKFALVAAPYLKEKLIEATQNWSSKPLIVSNEDKFDCFAASGGGIIKSGTSGLEYGFAKKPYVVFYKVNAISYYMIKRMIKTKFVNLINIIADKEIVPELIQNQATPENIGIKLGEVLARPKLQTEQITEVLRELYPAHGTPSDNAAKKIVEICEMSV